MLQKIVHRISYHRHPWRSVKFDELAEIYTSMTLRSLGFSLIGIFVPIYLYLNGVSLPDIMFFFVVFFISRIPISYVIAFVIGRIGPKHTIALSTIVFILFLYMLLSRQTLEWPLWLLAFMYSLSNGSFFVAYHTDFSKIKDRRNGGQELGWLMIFERIGGALGPLVGGLLASYISPELTIVVAIVILVVSLWPLFMTKEPVRLHQHVTFKGFPYRKQLYNFVSLSGLHIDRFASNVFWPLYIAIAVFTAGTYAKLGFITAFAMLISLFSAHMFGKFIDSRRGLSLMHFGIVMNAITHMLRPIATSPGAAIAISTLNEPETLAFSMPLYKGLYDEADSLPGYRIVYFALIEIFTSIAKALFCLAIWALSFRYDPLRILGGSFIVVAVLTSVMVLQRFPALKRV